MKYIKYVRKITSTALKDGGQTPVEYEFFSETVINYSEANIAVAQSEAYNGEYTIEDDGVEPQPTEEERIAELEATINALLGVSE